MDGSVCKNKIYANFKIKNKDCIKYRIFSGFSDIPLKEWSNITSLIEADKTSITATTSIQKYINCLQKVSTEMVKYPYVQDYANEAKKFLKLKSTRSIYQDEFDKAKENRQSKVSKRKLNHQTQLVSDAECLLKETKKLKKFKEQIAAEQEAPSLPSNIPHLNDNNTSSSLPFRKNTRNIKEVLYDCGKEIHEKYKQGQSLSGEQLKAMKCGLSCILDLSEAKEGFTRSLFEPEVWSGLVDKFMKLILKVPISDQSLKEKWEFIAASVISENNISTAQKYISLLHSKPDIGTEKQHVLDFFNQILYLIDCNKFILDPLNNTKVSERDFAYQIWLPLLKKLFHINNDLVRLKVGETVLSGSTYSKSDQYPNHDNIVGFKVDIRVIFDFKLEEFDIVCGEACIPLPGQDKLEHDITKLLREGKLMQTTLQNVIINPKESISWMLQLSGPTCSFYTSHNTKHSEYHVSVPQFTATFPSSYSQLADFFSVIEKLLMFRSSVEQIAHKLNSCIRSRLDKQQERTLQNVLGSPPHPPPSTFHSPPLYFTPPRRDNSVSLAPEYTPCVSEGSISEESGCGSDDEVDSDPDLFGFVLCRSGLYKNIKSDKISKHHPYRM